MSRHRYLVTFSGYFHTEGATRPYFGNDVVNLPHPMTADDLDTVREQIAGNLTTGTQQLADPAHILITMVYPLAPNTPPEGEAGGEGLVSQVDRLAAYIMENVPGEPSQNQGAVDTAIRVMRDLLAINRSPVEAVHRERATIEGLRVDVNAAIVDRDDRVAVETARVRVLRRDVDKLREQLTGAHDALAGVQVALTTGTDDTSRVVAAHDVVATYRERAGL